MTFDEPRQSNANSRLVARRAALTPNGAHGRTFHEPLLPRIAGTHLAAISNMRRAKHFALLQGEAVIRLDKDAGASR
jgi:hypothetical protein